MQMNKIILAKACTSMFMGKRQNISSTMWNTTNTSMFKNYSAPIILAKGVNVYIPDIYFTGHNRQCLGENAITLKVNNTLQNYTYCAVQ